MSATTFSFERYSELKAKGDKLSKQEQDEYGKLLGVLAGEVASGREVAKTNNIAIINDDDSKAFAKLVYQVHYHTFGQMMYSRYVMAEAVTRYTTLAAKHKALPVATSPSDLLKAIASMPEPFKTIAHRAQVAATTQFTTNWGKQLRSYVDTVASTSTGTK